MKIITGKPAGGWWRGGGWDWDAGKVNCPGKVAGGRGNLKVSMNAPIVHSVMAAGMNPGQESRNQSESNPRGHPKPARSKGVALGTDEGRGLFVCCWLCSLDIQLCAWSLRNIPCLPLHPAFLSFFLF